MPVDGGRGVSCPLGNVRHDIEGEVSTVLVVHRAERATVLADALAELLATPLDDPVAGELVAVPAKGVERWLAQRLSQRLGTADG